LSLAWPSPLSLPTNRDAIDNLAYFKAGGQCGLQTKRGCNRRCVYCADPLSKGATIRLRNPAEVADEAEALLARGIDVLHICDSEFNVPRNHAYAVCEEFNQRSLRKRLHISASLGERPAELIQDLIAGDKRVFGPMQEAPSEATNSNLSTDHNYNDNTELVKAINEGARGTYWDILRKLRGD